MKQREGSLQALVGAALRGEEAAQRYFREVGEKAAIEVAQAATRSVIGTLGRDLGETAAQDNDLFFRAATYLGLMECGEILSGQD